MLQLKEAKSKPVINIEALAPDGELAKEWAREQMWKWGWADGKVVSVVAKEIK
jgi:hypothetical protein